MNLNLNDFVNNENQANGTETGSTQYAVDLGTGSAARKRHPFHNMLMALFVVGVGGATLFAMRVSGDVNVASASDGKGWTEIDAALKRIKAGEKPQKDDPYGDTSKVISLFISDPSEKQVSPDKIQKNPFDLLIMRTKPAAQPVVEKVDHAAEQRVARLRAELKKLQVQSILDGQDRLAVVSNQVVREGMTIGSFTVEKITAKGVVVKAGDNTWTLTMEESGL